MTRVALLIISYIIACDVFFNCPTAESIKCIINHKIAYIVFPSDIDMAFKEFCS